MVQCQNTPTCPGAFYTLHDMTSQDFRVGLRWMFPAGSGFGFGGLPRSRHSLRRLNMCRLRPRNMCLRRPRNTCRLRRRNTCNRRCRAAADSGAAVPGRTDCMNRMKERAMRWVSAILLILLLILGMASPALAADYDLPILRGSSQPPAPVVTVGPATFTRWSGFYFGGNVSLGSATSDFSTATRPLVAVQPAAHDNRRPGDHPSDFQVLSRGSAVAAGGGAFLGYNTQWQDLILGVEATYTHTNLNTTAPVHTDRTLLPET